MIDTANTNIISGEGVQSTPEQKSQLKVSLSQDSFLAGLALVLKSVATRTNLPSITHVMLQATLEGTLILSTTDFETAIVYTLDADVEHAGVWTIPCRFLYDCVKSFSAKGQVQLEVDSGRLWVACGTRSFALEHGTDGDTYPTIPVAFPCGYLSTNTTELVQAIKEVKFAADDSDARPVFTAICMDIKQDHMNLVGADGFRIAVRSIGVSCELAQHEETTLLVPAPAMQLLAEIMPKDQQITWSWNEKQVEGVDKPVKQQVVFECGQVRMVSRLVEGTFPNYLAAIPRHHATSVTLSRSVLVSLITVAKPFWRDNSNILRITYNPTCLAFLAKSGELGEFRETIEAEVEGEADYILQNADYLLQFLKATSAKKITFFFGSSSHPFEGSVLPALMKPVGREDYCYTLMSMSPSR